MDTFPYSPIISEAKFLVGTPSVTVVYGFFLALCAVFFISLTTFFDNADINFFCSVSFPLDEAIADTLVGCPVGRVEACVDFEYFDDCGDEWEFVSGTSADFRLRDESIGANDNNDW